MHPAVATLALEEKGFVLAAALARTPPAEAARRLTGPAGPRCAAALEALAQAERPARASAIAELLALARAPLPAGIENVHPDWLRDRLASEPSAVVRAITAGLPDPVRRVAASLGADADADERGADDADAVNRLRRAIFGGLVPLAGAGAPVTPTARELCALPFEALVADVDRRGAELLGVSLRGAPPAVVARAAAALEPAARRNPQRVPDLPRRAAAAEPPSPNALSLARVLMDAAGRDGAPSARDEARRLVASIGKRASAEVVRELGVRALAAALAGEGPGAVTAVAQRLPIALGRLLLAAAADQAVIAWAEASSARRSPSREVGTL